MLQHRSLPSIVVAALVSLSCGGGDETPTGPGGNTNNPPPPPANVLPTASFTVSTQDGVAPVDITFDAAGSTDSDGTIASYSWTFGDGGTSTGAQVTHTYTDVGMFFIELTVVDDRGGSDSVRESVFVSSPPGTGANDIQGTAWWDRDLDGTQDPDEPALHHFLVFLDEDDDGKLDQGETLTFTDEDGAYSFAGLEAGTTYSVTQALPFGWTNTTPGQSPSPTARPMQNTSSSGGPARIINGEVATIEEFPFQVALMVDDFQFCGGTLINSKWVMTAAHCLVGADPSDFEVLHGTANVTIGGTRTAVESIRIPDEWGGASADWDIALIRIADPILGPRPFIHSPDEPQFVQPGVMSTTIGWGQIETGASPNDLRRVDLPIIDLKTCADFSGFLFSQIGDGALCAGEPNGGLGACFGDSGGPLLVVKDESWVQVGITSRGAGLTDCGRIPSVYALVSSMYDYITAVGQIEASGQYIVDWTGGPSFQANFGNYH